MNLGKKKLKVVSNLCEMENRQNVTRNQSKWEKMMVRPNHYWLLACLQQNTTRKQGRFGEESNSYHRPKKIC